MQKLPKLKKKLANHNQDKYIAASEFNKFSVEVFDARLSRANLVTKKILMINLIASVQIFQKG